MAERKVRIQNQMGLHMRPATRMADLARTFPCRLTVSKGGRTVTAASPLEILTLLAPYGTELVLRAQGERAEEAVEALARLVEDKFGME